MNEDQTLLTVKECATILNMSVSTFWRRIQDGTIPSPMKFGSLARWKHSDIMAVIEKASSERNKQAA